MHPHTRQPGRAALSGFFMVLILFLSSCRQANGVVQTGPDSTPPTQEPLVATRTLVPSQTFAPTFTLQPSETPTATPTATPLPTATSTSTPVFVPLDVLSEANAAKMKPVVMLTFGEREYPAQMAFNPDGGTLTIASGMRDAFGGGEYYGTAISLRSAATGEILKEMKIQNDGLLYPDGLRFLAFDEAKLYLYDLISGQVVAEQEPGNLLGCILYLGPDETHVVIYCYQQQRLEVWDLFRGASAFQPDGVHFLDNIAFSPDGSAVAIKQFSNINVYALKSGALLGSLPIAAAYGFTTLYFDDFALSPDGSLLAVSCNYDGYPAMQLWDVRSGTEVADWRNQSKSTGSRERIAFSPDGGWLASSAESKVFLFDGKTGKLLRSLSGGKPLAFSPDSRLLATAKEQGDVMVWGLEKGQLLASQRGHTQAIDGLLFSPTGKELASRQYDALVGLWGVLSSGEKVARAGISVTKGVSVIADSVPAAWLAGGGNPARFQIDIMIQSVTLDSCQYEGDHTLYLKQSNDVIVITDLETGTVIARHTFAGLRDPNSPGCLQTHYFTAQTDETYITYPDGAGFQAWLIKTMAPYGLLP